jgi:hypothetical protein
MERGMERGMRSSFCKQLNRLTFINSDQARFGTTQNNVRNSARLVSREESVTVGKQRIALSFFSFSFFFFFFFFAHR